MFMQLLKGNLSHKRNKGFSFWGASPPRPHNGGPPLGPASCPVQLLGGLAPQTPTRDSPLGPARGPRIFMKYSDPAVKFLPRVEIFRLSPSHYRKSRIRAWEIKYWSKLTLHALQPLNVYFTTIMLISADSTHPFQIHAFSSIWLVPGA